MDASTPPGDGLSRQGTSEKTGANGLATALRRSFCVLVLALAFFQFSENTADVDLWGHIVFGREMLHSHSIAKIEPYSWTAAGDPWFNHECFSEICLGGMHALMGGSGVLLLKMVIGLLSFAICLRLGLAALNWPGRYLAWAVAAIAVVEISYGFAARPQIFTALFLSFEMLVLTRVHSGKLAWAITLPFLFIVWINTHGGVLAGYGLLGLSAMATTGQILAQKYLPWWNAPATTAKIILTLWLCVALCGAALLCNPWGLELVIWTVKSVLWMRPEIQEWNSTPLAWDHAALFVLIIAAAFAWVFTERPRSWWQLAACGAFALLALRSVRNAPLCGFVVLALVPQHLASALAKFRSHFARIMELSERRSFQKIATVFFAAIGLAVIIATFTLHKQHPLTMEVPSREYPNAAVAFIEKNALRGKMITFFDWGEMVIFHLPDCPPSIDGRLDTCYSQAIIKAHWKFYNAEPFDEKALNVDAADLALLPRNLAGTAALTKRPGWQVIYYDELAVLLLHHPEKNPQLATLAVPVKGEKIVGLGREPFADHTPRWP